MKDLIRIPALISGFVAMLLQGCGAPSLPQVSHCWLQVFSEADFNPGGDHDIVFGPGAWADLRHLPGAHREDWTGAVRSVITGPAARASLWSESDFLGPSLTLEPGRPVPDLRVLGMRRFGSFTLDCPQ